MNYESLMWIAIFAVCLIVEAITTGLTSIWGCSGAAVAFILALASAPLYMQIVAFLFVTLVFACTTRKIARKHMEQNIVKTNAEALIGTHVFVTEEINNGKETGHVKINGIPWLAASTTGEVIPPETEVIITEISGCRVFVVPAER